MRFPYHFKFNEITAESNKFQSKSDFNVDKVKEEFNEAVLKITNQGIEILHDFPENESDTPDEIFPNNWFSSHPDGKLVLYPMAAPNRRLERSPFIINHLQKNGHSELIDFTSFESQNQFLEGTGSIIFDHQNKLAFACESERTNVQLFSSLCKQLGYQSFSFLSVDLSGFPIYHTNVVMSIGENYAVICLDSIENTIERNMINQALKQTGKTIIDITLNQMNLFCGNIFEVRNDNDELITLCSKTAFDAFTPNQRAQIEQTSKLVYCDIPTIEKIGGGSVRCMMAGIYR